MKLRATTLLSGIIAPLLFLNESNAAIHRPTANEFVVKGLEDVAPAFNSFDGEMFAGVLPIDPFEESETEPKAEDEPGRLMFWYFDTREPTVDDSLIFWFNGGPGCSSFDAGLLFEFGPAVTPSRPAGYFGGASERHAPLGPNPFSWTKSTDTVFIEQPVGVGFSSGGSEPQDESDVARDFIGFLQNFYDTFPNTRSKHLFLVGESYAGMYIPAIAHHIHQNNLKLGKHEADRHINLAGIAMGNAWVDAGTQGQVVIDYAYYHGMIDTVAREYFHKAWKNCYSPNKVDPFTKKQPKPFHSFTTPDECGIMESVMAAAGANIFSWGAPSIYDVTTWDPYDLINSANSTIESFFNNPRVRQALNVPTDAANWQGCIPGAGRRKLESKEESLEEGLRRRLHLLDFDKPVSMAPYMAELLDDAGIPVLIYNGDRDLSTCAQGSELVLNGMDWSGADDWLNPHSYRRGLWMVDDYPAGYSKTVQNLNFVIVYNSGHLVPMNVPKQALDLITRFLQGKPFIDNDIPLVYDAIESPKAKADCSTESSSETKELPWLVGFVAFVAGIVVSKLTSKLITNRKKRAGYVAIVETSIMK